MRKIIYVILAQAILLGCYTATKNYQIVGIKLERLIIENDTLMGHNAYLLDLETCPKDKYQSLPFTGPTPYGYGLGDSIRSIVIKNVHYKDITDSFTNPKDSLTNNYYLDFNKKQKTLLNQKYKIKDLMETINNNLFNYRTYISQTGDEEGHAHIYMIFYLPKNEKPNAIKICLKDKDIIGEVYKYPEFCSLKVFKETDFIHRNKIHETEE